MRLLVLLLLVGTANLVVCLENYFVFSLKVLLPDLQAIEQYMTKNPVGTIQAIIRWPNGISFEIRKVNEFLEIPGRFFTRKEYIFAYTGRHDKLYFKDGSFHMQYMDDSSLQRCTFISSDRTVYFRTDSVNDPKPFLSHKAKAEVKKLPKPDRYLYISYFSLNDVRHMIQPFYEANLGNFQSLSYVESPRTFLATTLKPYPYFVEYTMNRYKRYYHYASGPSRIENLPKLRVLVGEKGPYRAESYLPLWLRGPSYPNESNKMTIKSMEVSNLDFDLRSGLKTSGSYLSAEEVLGVRMASTGFLADVDNSGVKMLSSSDLTTGSRIPTEHKISSAVLLQKLLDVEPRFSYGKRDVPPPRRLNNVAFQIMGHVLVKGMNILDGGNLDESCPLFIQYKSKGPSFSYLGGTAKQICTDDSVLWVRPTGGRPSQFIDGYIILKYH